MSLSAVNTVGGVIGDRASVINFFSSFLPVGFTTKAFHHKRLFPSERLIRNVTGLGKVDVSTPHIRTPKRYATLRCASNWGRSISLAAGLAAADGVDVVIVDENARLADRVLLRVATPVRKDGEPLHAVERSAYPPLHRNTGGGVLRGSLGAVGGSRSPPNASENDDRRKCLYNPLCVPQQRPAWDNAGFGSATADLPLCCQADAAGWLLPTVTVTAPP